MNRYNTINILPGTMSLSNYESKSKTYSKSLTDKSHFIPVSEQVKALAFTGMTQTGGKYDYLDGHDDGRAVPLARHKSVDIAELSQDIRRSQADITDKINTLKRKQAAEKAYNDAFGDVSSSAANRS